MALAGEGAAGRESQGGSRRPTLGGSGRSRGEGDSPQDLGPPRRRLGELLAAAGPILLSGVPFALLGIDPQRPLVDSLIEN